MLGRKSIADKYYEETPEYEEEGTWIIVYNFGSKPNPRFWSNLKRLLTLVDAGAVVQYSVLKTSSKRGMVTAVKIARHYGASIMVFKGEEVLI